ncbi:MAG: thiamine-phosphate kinase [Bacteroidia bacterium]|nr:thiamine-phosphate kinase [Bacteroidia bacterium]
MFENTGSTTGLETLGEFGLIDHLTKQIQLKKTSSIKGVGDDAAVLNAEGKQIVVTTDILTEGIHFDLVYTPLKHLGYKSVAVNVSDICAMGAEPAQITVSIAVSAKFTVEALEEFYQGIYLACKQYKVDLVGGDTTSSAAGFTISVTAIGYANPDELIYRSGAKPTDLIIVTGDLGGAYVGLQLLNREKEVFLSNASIQPDLEGNDYILERQLKPEARTDIKPLLQALGVKPTSMIDISDGLASEILHICKASNVAATIYEEKIPIDPQTYRMAREFNIDPSTCALNGGEDYELLFTISLTDFDKIKGNPNLTPVGHITDKSEGNKLIAKGGSVYPIKAQGWQAFKKEGE